MTNDSRPQGQDALPTPTSAVTTPEAAIHALKQGNARFVANQTHLPVLGEAERQAIVSGQAPFAAVLACSDSRVPVELVFGQGFGDLFVVRLAGNVASSEAQGSLEFGVKLLGVKLLVVLGHQACGAVTAALRAPEQLADEPAHLRDLIGRVRPALTGLTSHPDSQDHLREAVLNNVRHQVAVLRGNPTFKAAEAQGQIRVIGAYYQISSGAVDFLDEHEAPSSTSPV